MSSNLEYENKYLRELVENLKEKCGKLEKWIEVLTIENTNLRYDNEKIRQYLHLK